MPSIPAYSPERAYMLRRSKEAVLKKIERNYDLKGIESEERLSADYGHVVGRFLASHNWQERKDQAAKLSGIPPEKFNSGQLDQLAFSTAIELAKADRIMGRIVHTSDQINDQIAATALADAYINHLSREKLSQIKSLGFSDKSTVSLYGQMVLMGLSLAKSPDFTVQPLYNPNRSIEETFAEIDGHWKGLRDVLNTIHKAGQDSSSRSH